MTVAKRVPLDVRFVGHQYLNAWGRSPRDRRVQGGTPKEVLGIHISPTSEQAANDLDLTVVCCEHER